MASLCGTGRCHVLTLLTFKTSGALASALDLTACFCVLVAWSLRFLRGTLPWNLHYGRSSCTLNTSTSPFLSGYFIRIQRWGENPNECIYDFCCRNIREFPALKRRPRRTFVTKSIAHPQQTLALTPFALYRGHLGHPCQAFVKLLHLSFPHSGGS